MSPNGASLWKRPRYQAGGGSSFLCFVVYGNVDLSTTLPAAKYRVQGMSEELEIIQYDSPEYAAEVESFRKGQAWEDLKIRDSAFAANIAAQTSCTVLRGELGDQRELYYLRDAVGIASWMVDQGGICVYDPQMFRWWTPEEWWRKAFEPVEPALRSQCVILTSPEGEGSEWVHTRGMRKFGRPDISIRGVKPEWRSAAIGLCDRFIEFQALGGLVGEGLEVNSPGFPEGFTCCGGGKLEDPEFGNALIEIRQ
ncbi:hypothetical protein OJ996_21385 [Luteolibacter sp. GHJ8]|uniref:Uncharacterized protein n=1 Tax=Luteolibacter rhizosphaerae TaxID=2989719 RepID=A0ABT3G954_9BACT|nr:hypothetical protein [Luteolibacter rhizosphaerae]MCW1916157.1 hypothetical protein [Luteolibacter rhizosphaerae]